MAVRNASVVDNFSVAGFFNQPLSITDSYFNVEYLTHD